MNSNTKQKELLLMLHSSFFSSQCVRMNSTEADGWYSQKEQLKDACRSGFSTKLLPECFNSAYNSPAPIWTINDANTFIDLVYCKYTQSKEKQYSVNPYIFMQVQVFN